MQNENHKESEGRRLSAKAEKAAGLDNSPVYLYNMTIFSISVN